MKHSKIFSVALALIVALTLVFAMSVTAFAEEAPTDETSVAAEAATEVSEDNTTSTKAIASAAIVGVVATAGAIGMAVSIAKTAESMARQPEAAGKINSAMMLGLVFIETAIIYALIIAILIIFVL